MDLLLRKKQTAFTTHSTLSEAIESTIQNFNGQTFNNIEILPLTIYN